jgi:hypothetical protein
MKIFKKGDKLKLSKIGLATFSSKRTDRLNQNSTAIVVGFGKIDKFSRDKGYVQGDILIVEIDGFKNKRRMHKDFWDKIVD